MRFGLHIVSCRFLVLDLGLSASRTRKRLRTSWHHLGIMGNTRHMKEKPSGASMNLTFDAITFGGK
jgi:hypothetical protein